MKSIENTRSERAFNNYYFQARSSRKELNENLTPLKRNKKRRVGTKVKGYRSNVLMEAGVNRIFVKRKIIELLFKLILLKIFSIQKSLFCIFGVG
jgi:hypothetical protein